MAVLDKDFTNEKIDKDIISLADCYGICPALLAQSYQMPVFADFVERNLLAGRPVKEITDVLWPKQVKLTMNVQEGHLFSDARREMDELSCASLVSANS